MHNDCLKFSLVQARKLHVYYVLDSQKISRNASRDRDSDTVRRTFVWEYWFGCCSDKFVSRVDADKILSLFLSFSLSWHWTDVLTNIKMKLSREVRAYLAAIRTIRDLQRANNLWQEILVFHVKLLINQGIYASTSYRTSFVQRGLRVSTSEWLATTSTKAIAMSVLNVVLMNNMLQASKLVI